MKVLLFLSSVLSTSAFAAPIGACAPATLANLIGNPCALGDKVFSNFSYTGNVNPSDINVDFQIADNGAEFRLILAPITGAGFFTNFTFTDSIAVVPGVAAESSSGDLPDCRPEGPVGLFVRAELFRVTRRRQQPGSDL